MANTKITSRVIADNAVGAAQIAANALGINDLSNATVSSSDPAIDTNPTGGVGTLWINSTSGEVYVCTSATTDLNSWINVGEGTGDVVPFSATGGTITNAGLNPV